MGELTTVATGKWTFTSGNPSRCQHHTSSSSLLRPGIPNLSTGTSTRGKRLNNPLTTKPNENEVERRAQGRRRRRRADTTNNVCRGNLPKRVDKSFFRPKKKPSERLVKHNPLERLFLNSLGTLFFDPLETPILNPPVSREISYVFVTFILFITYHL